MKNEDDFFEVSTQEPPMELVEEEKPQTPRPKKKARAGHILLAVFICIGCFVGGFFSYRLTLDKDFRKLLKIKDKIQEEYYEEVTDEAFYQAIFESVNASVQAGACKSDEDFFGAVYAGINENLLDTYSEYMTAEEYASVNVESTGMQSGIGIYFLSGTKDLLVQRVAGNSPAEDAGIQQGDTLTAVGTSVSKLQPCETRGDFSAFIVNVEFGDEFYLQWRTEAGETKIAKIKKTVYVENYVYYKTNAVSYGFDSGLLHKTKTVGEPLTYLNDDTAYIKIVRFNGNVSSVFDKAMYLFKSENKKDLVIDLRGNGGGYMDSMQEMTKYFCKNTEEAFPVVAIADYGERIEEFRTLGNIYDMYFAEDSRITVLADNMSASASECFIGCMYAYEAIGYEDICLVEEADGRAKTYGKGIMQTTFKIGDGSALKLTTAKLLWPLEEKYGIHGVGITKADGAKTVSSALAYQAQTRQAIENLYS